MNRVAKRSTIALLLALFLVGGMVFFLGEYLVKAPEWAVFPGNPHVYNGTNIGCGTITDRDGTVLLQDQEGRSYAEDETLRRATIHWLGDRQGYISAPAVTNYAKEMAGYSRINGLYRYGGGGGSARMTLSADLQRLAQEAMGDRKGTVGVYNYKTGEILCAVSTPNYDPDHVPDIAGDTTGAYEGAYLNRFTQVSYVPGSIFKIISTAAALETMKDAENLQFTCTGTYQMGADEVTCGGVHGTIGMKTALAKSCNCYFAQLVQAMGKDTLEEYVEKTKVLEPVTFDGITTSKGSFDVEQAAPVQVAWSGIGQHKDLVNPCRFMTVMGAIAGGGEAAEPYVVAQVQSGGKTEYRASAHSTGRLLKKQTCQTLTELMRNNVRTVYGDSNFPGLNVCAKSGTAQVGGGRQPNATFAGFVADEAYPLAFVVVVENGGAGSDACVPIISKVLTGCKALMDSE